MSTTASTAFRLTGWHVLASVVLFFGVFITVDVLMAIDAYRTYSGEVSTSPYEDGLAYDSQLDQQRNQARLAWKMALGLTGPGEIRLSAATASGQALDGLMVTGRLERPATEKGRIDLVFQPRGGGVYVARAGRLPAGGWDARISAYDRHGRRFDAERRLIAP